MEHNFKRDVISAACGVTVGCVFFLFFFIVNYLDGQGATVTWWQGIYIGWLSEYINRQIWNQWRWGSWD